MLRGYYLSALELVSQGDGALNPQFHVGNPNLHLKEARLRVEDALGACLLPSLQLVPANPAVGQEIWELMSLLPYEVFLCICCLSFYLIYCYPLCTRLVDECYLSRHDIIYMVNGKKMTIAILCCWLQDKLPRFDDLHTSGLSVLNVTSDSSLCLFSLLYFYTQLDTRRILKRLAKENLKQLGRMVAKLAHANPMTVLRTIVHQVLIY